MRIALYHHTPSNPDSGASRVYHILGEGLGGAGHDVRVRHLDDMGLPRSATGQLLLTRFALPRLVSSYAWRDRRETDDLVMSSSGMCAPFFKRLKAQGGRRPLLVGHIHGLTAYDHAANMSESHVGHWRTSAAYRLVTGPTQMRWDRASVSESDVTVVQNKRDLGEITSSGPLKRPVRMICPPVHPDILTASLEAPDASARDRHRILWFGTWESRKGSYYVPSAFRRLRDVVPEAKLVVGGSGKSPGEILSHFAAEDRAAVEVVGRLTREEHIRLMGSCSIFLFPSLSEGFGLALAESMSMGLAAVTTGTAFGGDHLHDGLSARIVPPTSVHVGEALTDLVLKDEFRIALATAGRKVAQSFTQRRMVEQYVQLFEEELEVHRESS